MSEPVPDPRPAPTGAAKRGWLIFFGIATFAAGLGFAVKVWEFTSDLLAQEGIQFAGVHLLTYALVAGGFLSLLVFCFLKGHFADIEQPKHDLIERERNYDRQRFA